MLDTAADLSMQTTVVQIYTIIKIDQQVVCVCVCVLSCENKYINII